MKKNFLKILLFTPILFTSCSRFLTKDQAIEFANTNFKDHYEDRNAYKISISWDYSGSIGTEGKIISKTNLAVLLINYNINFSEETGTKIYSTSDKLGMIQYTKDDFKLLTELDDVEETYTFKVNHLTTQCIKDENGIKTELTNTYTIDGYLTYSFSSYEEKINNDLVSYSYSLIWHL